MKELRFRVVSAGRHGEAVLECTCDILAPRGVMEPSRSSGPTHLGTRCRGQGTSPNSCGHDRTKLKIWGRKKRSNVLE